MGAIAVGAPPQGAAAPPCAHAGRVTAIVATADSTGNVHAHRMFIAQSPAAPKGACQVGFRSDRHVRRRFRGYGRFPKWEARRLPRRHGPTPVQPVGSTGRRDSVPLVAHSSRSTEPIGAALRTESELTA